MPDSTTDWCFVHAADLHLDTPFEGIAHADPALGSRLRDASLEAFDALIDLTLERGAAFLLLAGDLYDGAVRGVRAQLRVHAGLARLSAAGIATCIVSGNHDPLETGWSAIRAWPDGVTVFDSSAPGVVEVEHAGQTVAVVTGVSYAEQAERRNLAAMLERTHADVLHVGLVHASVGDHPDHSTYAPCSVEDLRSGGMDYWALGHIHAREVVLDGSNGDPWAVYPGNLQGRSPRASERGAKGASVAHVRDGRVAEVEHVSLDRVRFAEVEVTLAPDDDLAAVHARLAEGARRAGAEADGRALVLRGRLTGHGEVHADLARPGALEELRKALADEAPSDPACSWSGVVDRTGPPPDAEATAQAEGLLADLAAVVAEAEADAEIWTADALAAARAVEVDVAVAGGRELVSRAAALAAAELGRDR